MRASCSTRLARIVFNRGFRSFDRRARLHDLRLIVVVLQFQKQVALINLLIIGDLHVAHYRHRS